MNEYLDNILSVINVDAIRKRDLRVAVDPMYGVSLTALSTILAVARCTVETINAQHDTFLEVRCRHRHKIPLKTFRTMCWTVIVILVLQRTVRRPVRCY